MDRTGKAGLRAGTLPAAGERGWLLHSSFGRRCGVGKEVGTWHLWGHGGELLLGKHRKLKDAPSVLYPSDSTLSPLEARKKMIKESKCFYL